MPKSEAGYKKMRQNKKSSVNLHIEELVLHGFPQQDKYRIARALEHELARLLSQGDIPSVLSQGGVISGLDGGSFQTRPGTSPETTGARVAQNLYGGLKKWAPGQGSEEKLRLRRRSRQFRTGL
jgi:hypothetical protein